METVRVHGETHRAPGTPPFESGIEKNLVKPLCLGCLAHRFRAGHDQRFHVAGHLLPFGDAGCLT